MVKNFLDLLQAHTDYRLTLFAGRVDGNNVEVKRYVIAKKNT